MTKCLNPECGRVVPLKKEKRKAKYCSAKCARVHYQERAGFGRLGLSPGTAGAVGEMVVCVDLLRQGFEVFRAVSPSCSCDLIALRDKHSWRVEVKQAQRNEITGKVAVNLPNRERCDVLASVIGNEVVYDPELV